MLAAPPCYGLSLRGGRVCWVVMACVGVSRLLCKVQLFILGVSDKARVGCCVVLGVCQVCFGLLGVYEGCWGFEGFVDCDRNGFAVGIGRSEDTSPGTRPGATIPERKDWTACGLGLAITSKGQTSNCGCLWTLKLKCLTQNHALSNIKYQTQTQTFWVKLGHIVGAKLVIFGGLDASTH
jgi:hypothetical protein